MTARCTAAASSDKFDLDFKIVDSALLRDLTLATGRRTIIIATNTIAQGDTRQVGLDQATAAGWKVYRAIKSQPWPGKAALDVSLP